MFLLIIPPMFGGEYLCDRIFATISKNVQNSKALENKGIDGTRKPYNVLEERPYFTQIFSDFACMKTR